MKSFLSQKDVERKELARRRSLNPCPGRKQKHYQRITRRLDQVVGRIRIYLEQTGYANRKWLPSESVVTSNDDEWQYDLYAQVQEGTYNLDDDGYMVDWHDPGIKATNRIVAVTWYDNHKGDGMIIKKPVLCPIPCKQWGRLPITLVQWRRIAMTLVESEQLWRWVHSVRLYNNDNDFMPSGIAGWHLEPTQVVVSHEKLAAAGKGYIIDMRSQDEQLQEAEGWIGRNLYRDIIAEFSLDD